MDGFEADDFVSLAELHFKREVTIGALATAIEEKGVWGWDRFGRFVLLPLSSPAAQGALNRLARQHEYNDGTCEPEEPYLDPSSDLLYFHGWCVKDMPGFADIAVRPSARRRPSDIRRVENGLHMKLGALLEFALGLGRWKGCPQFPSQEKLIEAFEEYYEGMPAMSARSLDTAFAEARRVLKLT